MDFDGQRSTCSCPWWKPSMQLCPYFLAGIMKFRQMKRDLCRWSLVADEVCFSKLWHSVMFSLGRCVPVIRGEGVYQKPMDFTLEKIRYRWLGPHFSWRYVYLLKVFACFKGKKNEYFKYVSVSCNFKNRLLSSCLFKKSKYKYHLRDPLSIWLWGFPNCLCLFLYSTFCVACEA